MLYSLSYVPVTGAWVMDHWQKVIGSFTQLLLLYPEYCRNNLKRQLFFTFPLVLVACVHDNILHVNDNESVSDNDNNVGRTQWH